MNKKTTCEIEEQNVQQNDTADKGALVYIPIDKLAHHPDNPRKDLGDLTELADSIRQNGILQNLTVVPWFSTLTGVGADNPKDQEEMGYYVVIGNRRMEASKKAGLTELPCVIADMTRQEQVSTMMVENMQRSDLTVYEQAQGFQMMIDFGDNIETIAEKSGFSQSTIRRRVKLLDLDKDKFKESEARGVTLESYMALDAVKDIETKNKLLEVIGTDNFKFELRRAVDKEKADAKKAAIIEKLKSFATEIEKVEKGYLPAGTICAWDGPKKVNVPEDADTVEYFFTTTDYGYYYIYKKGDPEAKAADEEEYRRKEAEKKALIANLQEVSNCATAMREEFEENLPTATIKKHMTEILAYWMFIGAKNDTYHIDNDDVAVNVLGLPTGEDGSIEEFTYDDVLTEVSKTPEIKLWRMVCLCAGEGKYKNYFRSYDGQHTENEELDHLYDLLIRLGYPMSDEEKQLRDGTHHLFNSQEKVDQCGV